MKIASIAYRVPANKLTNDDLIEHISKCNPEISAFKKNSFKLLILGRLIVLIVTFGIFPTPHQKLLNGDKASMNFGGRV